MIIKFIIATTCVCFSIFSISVNAAQIIHRSNLDGTGLTELVSFYDTPGQAFIALDEGAG